MRDLLIVRTHLPDRESLSAYDRYAALGCFDVVFCCDERRGPVDCGGRNKVRFDNDRLTAMGLQAHKDCGWRCGDYFYYVTRTDRPDYSYYWMVEPDVYVNTSDLDGFFAKFKSSSEDFLAARLGPRHQHWTWYATVRENYEAVFGCLFPFTRISGRAIDRCMGARLIASQRPHANPKLWPNDEALVASELLNNGYACSDFNTGEQVVYTRASFRSAKVPHDLEILVENPPDGLVYHPVRSFSAWLGKIEVNLQNRFLHQGRAAGDGHPPRLTRSAASQLDGAAEVFLQERSDAALIALMLSRHAWRERVWSDRLPHITAEVDGRRAQLAHRKIKKHFAAAQDKVATVQVGTTRPTLNPLVVSSADDFLLGAPEDIGRFPTDFAIPYAFDFDSHEYLFTLHVNPKAAFEKPFLYAAQRQKVVVVAKLPWDRLGEFYGEPDSRQPPMFIFSIGRTGSTLLEAVLACITGRAVSEPDSITQLAVNRRMVKSLPDLTRKQLFWHSVSPFLPNDENRGEVPRPIKLRSQLNSAVSDVLEHFPNAKYVFMLRDRLPWARSTYRAFGLEPKQVASRLKNGFKALHALSTAASPMVITYEELLAGPAALIARILGPDQPLSANVERQISAIMAVDSQEQSAISRDKTSQTAGDEDAWLGAFEEAWRAVRPGKILDNLGIDYK